MDSWRYVCRTGLEIRQSDLKRTLRGNQPRQTTSSVLAFAWSFAAQSDVNAKRGTHARRGGLLQASNPGQNEDAIALHPHLPLATSSCHSSAAVFAVLSRVRHAKGLCFMSPRLP